MIDQTPVLATPERLLDVALYDLDSAQLRRRLDEVAAQSAARIGTPAAAVTVVLDTVQFFAGRHGLNGLAEAAGGTPLEWAFCAQVAARNAAFVVPDAVVDPIQHDSPLVTQEGVRAYAGVPIVSPRGQVIGAHCVVDDMPREFDEDDLAVLEAGARLALDALEAHRLA